MADEWVPLREAADRLGISTDTVRRRLKRGELTGEQRTTAHGPSWFVQIPEQGKDGEDEAAAPATSDERELITLRTRAEGLAAQLAQAEADRDRWHQLAVDAIDRAHRERDEMRALLAREQAIALSANSSTGAAQGDAQADADAESRHAQAHDVVVGNAAEGQRAQASLWQRIRTSLGI